MSAAVGKRKRVRKACNPCHQRKRKCDIDKQFPCTMCVVYEYNCTYSNNSNSVASTDVVDRGPESTVRNPDESFTPIEPFVATADSTISNEPLTTDINSRDAIRYQSFAYNVGTRPGETAQAYGSLLDLIDRNELVHYSTIFFTGMSSIFDVIDWTVYTQRLQDYFRDPSSAVTSSTIAFTATAAGIAALGSFLSSNGHPQESKLVQYAKGILDDPRSTKILTVDHVVAWAIRVLYLRATAPPNNAWIASCTMMHFCEVVGLHDEISIQKLASSSGALALGQDVLRLRRIFWIAWAGNTILSYECDRSSVYFQKVTTQNIAPTPGYMTNQFIRLAQIVPTPNSPYRPANQSGSQIDDLFERLKALQQIQINDPFLIITRADLAFCFFRRAHELKTGIPESFTQLVIDNGNASLQASEQLISQGLFFWNIMGSIFHYTCILMAMGDQLASTNLKSAFKALRNLATAAKTNQTSEALATASNLLDLHIEKRRKELDEMELVRSMGSTRPPPALLQTSTYAQDIDYGVDWDQFFLEPYLNMANFDS